MQTCHSAATASKTDVEVKTERKEEGDLSDIYTAADVFLKCECNLLL